MVLEIITPLLEKEYTDKKRFGRAIRILKNPQNSFKKKLSLKLSNGKKGVFQTFRVQHSDSLGPYMGGVKYSPVLTEDEVKKLAVFESLKSSLVDIPFGGSFGGIIVDIKKLISKDLERITKCYSQFLSANIGSWKDILTPNAGVHDQTMSWMMDSYEKKKKFHSPATFTTNKYNLDGAVFVLDEFIKTSNIFSRFRKLDVAISGFGDRAYAFASNLNKQNFRIVALSDSKGGVVNSNGFNIEEIKKLKDKFYDLKEVSVMNDIEFISNEKLLELPVDILVIATKKTEVGLVKAKIVLEMTNKELEIPNTIILPSLLLNSGFNVIAHLDWVQKMHGYNWSREEVIKKLSTKMKKTFFEVKTIVDENKLSYREASYYLGLKRIIDVMMERGRV
jgi:glutamate dehydrogenase/leucine dehydrogenase